MKTLQFALFFLLLFFNETDAIAQWSTDAGIDNALNATVYNPLTFCSDGHGGAFFTWSQTFTGVRHDVIINRIDSLGYLLFGDSGLIIHSDSVSLIAAGDPNICEDGNGGCYVVFNDNKPGVHGLTCHHIDFAGNKLWGATGVQVTERLKSQYYQTGQVLLNDNGAGVKLAFITNIAGTDTSNANTGPSGLYAQRLDFAGNRQWGVNGTVIQAGSDQRQPMAIDDGQNGMTVMWTNYSYEGQGFNYTMRVNRLDHNGQLRFTAGSRKINTNSNIGFGPAYSLALTQSKNYIAVWNSDGNQPILYTQKLDSIGNFLWADTAIRIRDTIGEARYPNLVTDGDDGAFVTWIDGRKVNVSFGLYAQHLNNSGTRQWGKQGKAIDTAASANFPQILTDTANGFKAFWIPTADNRMHLQQVKNDGGLLLPGNGNTYSAAGHVPFYRRSVLPVANNRSILFMKLAGNGKCFAKLVPFSSILPLTFTLFNAVADGSKNVLTWQTSAAINAGSFSIERSEDGSNFHEIATMRGAANSIATTTYTYSDLTAAAATYYRIKETDNSGQIVFSKIARLYRQEHTRLVPNPASTVCTWYFEGPATQKTNVTVSAINGSKQMEVAVPRGQLFASINVLALPAGTYVCRCRLNNKTLTRKLIVVH